MDQPELQQLADRLILLVRSKPEQAFDWESLQKKLGRDRAALAQAVTIAQAWGYRLKVRASSGIQFRSAPDSLTATEIGFDLHTKWLGKQIHAYQSVKSTNDLASVLAEQGAAEGTVVVAEQQTKGRGRLGRSWHSPPGSGIYLSLILRPTFTPDKAPGLAIMTAVALADAVSGHVANVRIKWPNDLLIGGKKVAGILTELSAERETIHHVIVGVGINVNHGVGSFPPELRNMATSIRRAGRRKVNRVALLQSFLLNFEQAYRSYQQSQLARLHASVRGYSALIGSQIEIAVGKSVTSGEVVDIDREGRLILMTDQGRSAITAGEVTIVKR